MNSSETYNSTAGERGEEEMEFLFPPVPEGKITPQELPYFENKGFLCQRKYNGTHNVIYICTKTKKVKLFTRHGWANKQFDVPESLKKQFLSLNLEKNKEYLLDGELLNSKTKNYKGKVVLYDVLRAGQFLDKFRCEGKTPSLVERLQILHEIAGNPIKVETSQATKNKKYPGLALEVSEDIWLAQSWSENFADRFDDFIECEEIEGLVLKKMDSVLDNAGSREYHVNWMTRCRKPHKNYSH